MQLYEEMGNPEPRPPAMEIIAPFMSPYEFMEGMNSAPGQWPRSYWREYVRHQIILPFPAISTR